MTAVRDIYARLRAHFGPSGWWPAETPFEVIAGAILVQNCTWHNATLALDNLRREGLLSPEGLRDVDAERLGELIRPSGYYRSKSMKLKAFVGHLWDRYGGSVEAMAARPLGELRTELLGVYGIGPETADSILNYALGKPVMVVDAYTARAFHRLGLLPEKVKYADMQALFMAGLPPETAVFQDYHGLIVRLGQEYCRKRQPACSRCPLADTCPRIGLGEAG